jgi:hypothetical protein
VEGVWGNREVPPDPASRNRLAPASGPLLHAHDPGLGRGGSGSAVAVEDGHRRDMPPRVLGIVRHRDRYQQAAARAFVETAVDMARSIKRDP